MYRTKRQLNKIYIPVRNGINSVRVLSTPSAKAIVDSFRMEFSRDCWKKQDPCVWFVLGLVGEKERPRMSQENFERSKDVPERLHSSIRLWAQQLDTTNRHCHWTPSWSTWFPAPSGTEGDGGPACACVSFHLSIIWVYSLIQQRFPRIW